jgi:hypothetical protein
VKKHFKLNESDSIVNNIEKFTFLSNGQNTIYINQNKVIIIDNLRVYNLFKNKLLDLNNFESEYFKYLNYGLVIIIGEKRITIYNDIYGAYPVFKYLSSDELLIAISNYYEPTPESIINATAVVEFIHFNHFLGSSTLYSNIERLPGGNKIEINLNCIKITSIINWETIVNYFLTTAICANPYEYLKKTINETINENDLTLTLTGGYDSRLLFSILLSDFRRFKNITFGIPGNLQTIIAEGLSRDFSVPHINLSLDTNFTNKIKKYLDFILNYTKETPFIVDVAPFIYMCESLLEGTNLISGLMGSEIIRGPSVSSQVTLTEFAARICLSKDRQEIKQKILDFQRAYPYINNSFLNKHLDQIVEKYHKYAVDKKLNQFKNYNVFKYLFYEKYPKIFGQFIKIHHYYGMNLINPYMDFQFISSVFSKNMAFTKMTPFKNTQYDNFLLYRFYAKEIAKFYPKMLKTKIDRGYMINDLITCNGYLKLIPIQIIRKFIKKFKTTKTAKVVDSYSWYLKYLMDIEMSRQNKFEEIINFKTFFRNSKELNDLERIKVQIISGLLNT